MYGRGNPGSQFGQGFQSAVRHPYQQHVPSRFPPPSSGQPQAGTYPGPSTPSGQFVQTGVPTYEHMPRPPPNPTNQSYVHAPVHLPPPPPPPIHGALQMPRAYLNVQQNAPNTAYAGNPNLHHIPTPLPPRAVPPLQGQTTYWSRANFQTLPVGAQVPLPSVPSSDPSGSTSSATPSTGENPMSLMSLPPPPPPPTSPPPMQPSPPSFGCLPPAPSLPTTLSSQMHIQDNGKAADSEGDVEAQDGGEHGFSRYGDTIIREDKGSNVVNSQAGDKFVLDGSVVSDLLPPPVKPKEEKVLQKIEVLCQFIAKNGPGFEEMARQKESGNPEFKFLFGGEPGSETAIAHEYFQWLKKKYNMEYRSQEESTDNSSRLLKEHSSVRHVQSMATRSMDIHSDSDMEMEDDITHTDKDTGMGQSADMLSQEGDKKELAMPQNGQMCSPPSGFSSDKFPCSGTTGLDGQVIKNGSPFKLLQDYSSDESSDIDDKTLPREEDTESVRPTVGGASSAGSEDNKSKFETNLGSTILGEGEKDYRALPECNLKAATNSFESRREVKMTTPNILASGLSGKTFEEDNDKKESVPNAPSSEAFQMERGLMSSSDNIGVSNRSDKENAENIQEPGSASLKVDEFGRLLRDKTNDSDSDDSRSAERYNRKGKYRRRSRSWSRSRSPVDRRSRQKRRERRSTSRSWSPRKQRSRSRSPVLRRPREFRHDNIRRDKSRMPECFDFLRGKCYRGASCRYWHHDADLDRSRHQQRKRQNLEVSSVQEKFDSIGEKDLSQGRSNFGDHEVKVKANEKMPGKILSSTKDRNSEDPLMDTEQVSVFDVHGLSDDNKKIPTQKDEQMVQEGFLDSSSRNNDAKSSQGMENDLPHSIGWTDQPVANAESESLRADVADARHHASQPSVHLPPTMQGEGAQNFHQPMLDANMPLASSYAPQPANGEGLSSNALSSSQQFPFPLPQVPWSSMPPLPVPPVHHASSAGNATPSVYNDHQLMPYATSVRSYSTEIPSHSYVGQFQHQASNLTQNPSRPQMYTTDYRIGTLPGSNLQNQRIGDSGLTGELHSRGIQSYSSGSVPPAVSSQSSSQTYVYPQQLLSPGVHYGKATNNLDMATSMSSGLHPIPDKNPTSHVPDFGGSRLSTHYNPYASTFEQPLSSKFTSDITMQDLRNRYNTPSQLVHCPIGQATSSPRSAAAIPQNIPPSHGDQYDPLFDSIEPSLNSEKRSDHALHSRLKKPLDVEKNNKKLEIGPFSASTSLDDDGFGETAEAEVGAVENASPSDPADLANVTGNDVEIDQVKSPDKNKKRKDSRSMKLFKVALADFVKEVLRPSWRQGNMSKEAFKTIVKKTVDKVTGSMKGRRMPKSQAKINHYIDSSQRKLTKLVMGYVDKYVKV